MSQADDAAPESEPPPIDPEVREELDRMEEERDLPEADESADRDEDAEEQTEGEAPTG
jgi:hypothetical protein